MAEPYACAELQQSGRLRRGRRLEVRAEVRAGTLEQPRITAGPRRGDQRQPARVVGQYREAMVKAPLDPPRDRIREGETARDGGRTCAACQFQQRERIATRLGDDSFADRRVERRQDLR